MTFSMSRPAATAKCSASARAFDQPADADLIDHLGELARARWPDQVDGTGIGVDHRLGFAELRRIAADHHRERAVLGARLAARHRARRAQPAPRLLGGRMQLAGDLGRRRGVVDRTPRLGRSAWNAPSRPRVTARRSSSLPTQVKTKSAPSAASAGEGADMPPNFATQASALAGVRLNTVTAWPPRVWRWPAMGKPMVPSPIHATLLIARSSDRLLGMTINEHGRDRARPCSSADMRGDVRG